MENIVINTEYIKLDQILKFSNIVSDGSDAKYLIASGCVFVNGQKELRRGRKLYKDDIVKVIYEQNTFELKVCDN